MSKLTRKKVVLILLGIAAVALLANFSPSYTYVSVGDPKGDIKVERAGFGPQSVRVEKSDIRIESSSR
jgi:hypothetical protein